MSYTMTTREAIDTRKVQALEAQLATGQEKLSAATDVMTRERSRSEAVTPGGLAGYDPAVLSGIRRKSSPRADARRYSAYAREAEARLRLDRLRDEVRRLGNALSAAIVERDRVRLTRDDVVGAEYVCTRFGWYSVVKVNAKTVSVTTPFSWTDKIPLEEILAIR